MSAETVGDLASRERRSDDPAVIDARTGRVDGYRVACDTACKVGNVLRYLGVREGDRVALEAAPRPQVVASLLGAALLGAVVEFGVEAGTDARAVVVDAARESAFDLPRGSRLLAFGAEPDRAATTHWETAVWSENPAFPSTGRDPEAAVLAAEGETYSHREVLVAARAVVDELGLDGDSRVAADAPLSDPRAVVAGVLAPLVAGGAVWLPAGTRATPDRTPAGGDDPADLPGPTAVVGDGGGGATGLPTLELASVPLPP